MLVFYWEMFVLNLGFSASALSVGVQDLFGCIDAISILLIV